LHLFSYVLSLFGPTNVLKFAFLKLVPEI